MSTSFKSFGGWQEWWWWSQAIEEEGTDDDDYDSGGSAGIALTPPDSPGCMRQVVIHDESLPPRTANSIFRQNSTFLLIRTRVDFLLKWTGKIQNHEVIQKWPFSSQSLELGRAHKKASSIVNATIDPDKVEDPYFSQSFKQFGVSGHLCNPFTRYGQLKF